MSSNSSSRSIVRTSVRAVSALKGSDRSIVTLETIQPTKITIQGYRTYDTLHIGRLGDFKDPKRTSLQEEKTKSSVDDDFHHYKHPHISPTNALSCDIPHSEDDQSFSSSSFDSCQSDESCDSKEHVNEQPRISSENANSTVDIEDVKLYRTSNPDCYRVIRAKSRHKSRREVFDANVETLAMIQGMVSQGPQHYPSPACMVQIARMQQYDSINQLMVDKAHMTKRHSMSYEDVHEDLVATGPKGGMYKIDANGSRRYLQHR